MKIRGVCLILAMMLMIGVASATTITGASRSVLLKGPSGLLVPLGIEYVVPLNEALVYYNWLSIGIIFLVGATASRRDTKFVGLFLPIIAGVLVWFGWFSSPDPLKTYSTIIMCGLLGAGIYYSDTLHENFGIGGPGNKIINFTFYMILLSAVVGMMNASAIWQDNQVPMSEQMTRWANVDLSSEVSSMTNTGGFWNDVASIGSQLIQIGIGALKIFTSIMLSVGVFSVTLLIIFPILKTSAMAIALLGVMQVGIWLLYAKFVNDFFYMKSVGVSDF